MIRPEPTIWSNINDLLYHLGEPFTELIPTQHDPDRIYGWEYEHGDRVYTFCKENWDRDPEFISQVTHGTPEAYREPGGAIPCLQLCFHRDPETGRIFWEGDLDYSSWRGVPGFLVHGLEVAYNTVFRKKTNQAFVRWLLERRIKKEIKKKKCTLN